MKNEKRDGTRTPTPVNDGGPISISEIYRLEDAKRRLGWSDSALRAAKRRGLRLLACGKRRYVTGTEVLRFLESENGIS